MTVATLKLQYPKVETKFLYHRAYKNFFSEFFLSLLSIIYLFQPSVAFHIETSHLFCSAKNDWVLYEMQHLAEMN